MGILCMLFCLCPDQKSGAVTPSRRGRHAVDAAAATHADLTPSKRHRTMEQSVPETVATAPGRARQRHGNKASTAKDAELVVQQQTTASTATPGRLQRSSKAEGIEDGTPEMKTYSRRRSRSVPAAALVSGSDADAAGTSAALTSTVTPKRGRRHGMAQAAASTPEKAVGMNEASIKGAKGSGITPLVDKFNKSAKIRSPQLPATAQAVQQQQQVQGLVAQQPVQRATNARQARLNYLTSLAKPSGHTSSPAVQEQGNSAVATNGSGIAHGLPWSCPAVCSCVF